MSSPWHRLPALKLKFLSSVKQPASQNLNMLEDGRLSFKDLTLLSQWLLHHILNLLLHFLGQELLIEGSLGGLQVLDLTCEGRTHQRILSLGQDPLTESLNSRLDLMANLSADLYNLGSHSHIHSRRAQDKEAFSFTLRRQLHSQSG